MLAAFRFAAVHMRLMVCTWLVSTVAGSLACAAEPPKIERIEPAGAQRGTTVEVSLPGKPGDGTLQVWSAASQLTFEISEKKDAATVTVPLDAELGLHWIRFHNAQGASDLLPFVVGTTAEATEAEPNDRLNDVAAKTPVPVTINGVLSKSGDVDIHAFDAAAGTTLVAALEAHRSLKSPVDAVLQLLDRSGTVLSQNDDDHGFDPQIVYQVTQPGTYFVRLFAFPSTPNSTIKFAGAASYLYRLTLTTGPFIDHACPATIAANTSHQVALNGWNLPGDLSHISVPPFSATAKTIDAKGALPVTLFSTRQHVTTESSVADRHIERPISLTGHILTANETDEYTFIAKKGQQLVVRTRCAELYSPLDPVVTVRSSDGKVLKENDDSGRDSRDSVAEVKIPADGAYAVAITDRFGNGGERFVYVLEVFDARPTFELTLKSDSLVLIEQDVEIPVTVNRQHGFSEAISVTAEDLPPGVTAEPVISEAKGDSAKSVRLFLKRDPDSAAAFGGAVRIVGTAVDSMLHQTATATISNSTSVTPHVWLTVIASQGEPRGNAAESVD